MQPSTGEHLLTTKTNELADSADRTGADAAEGSNAIPDAAAIPEGKILIEIRTFPSGRYGWRVSRSESIQATSDNPEKDIDVKPYDAIASSSAVFVNKTASMITTAGLLRRLCRDATQQTFSTVVLPQLKLQGSAADPGPDFAEAYIAEGSFFYGSGGWRDIQKSRQARDSVLPMILTSMTTLYDVLVTEILSAYFRAAPYPKDKSDKQFSIHDLLQFSSIEEARQSVIEREIESVMYGSRASQIEWFEKRMKIDITENLHNMAEFSELFETRNIYVHADGVINSRYIQNCKKWGIKSEALGEIGSERELTFGYINKGSELLIETGIILSQSVWRALFKKDKTGILAADTSLLRDAEMLVRSSRPEIAARILQMGYEKFVPSSELARRQMIIKHAGAAILMTEKDEAKRLLDSHDWSACDARLKTYVHSMRGETAEALTNLKIAGISGLLSPEEVMTETSLEALRLSETFDAVFQETFGTSSSEAKDARIAAEVADNSSDQTGRSDVSEA